MTTMPAASWDLARRAADRIVGRPAHPSVARAVLAQWIAEHGYQWPFTRNNPGNLAKGWAGAFPYPFEVHFPNPQPGNPIVTFATQQAGADAYAAGLTRFARYAGAVGQARAGDGLEFAVRVCRAGYGTRESAVRTVYASLAGPASPGPAPSTGGPNVAIRYSQVAATGSHMRLKAGQAIYDRPGGTRVTSVHLDALFPHVGTAGVLAGKAWRAIVARTRWSYADGLAHPTVLYVPASAGEVISG